MSTKHRVATFNILVVLALAATLATIIAVESASAQNSTNEQRSSNIGSNGTSSASGNSSSTGAGTKVSIVEEASEMGDQAYDPNPVKIKSGDSVTWTNDDSQIHTVTSGTGSDDPNLGKDFDSSMLSQNQTFSHKFTTAGEFPYFCQLHPTMVAKVVVS
jgi:plastocyanin